MGQIAQQLLALNSAKHAIRQAINDKGGGPLSKGAPLAAYPGAIAAIPTGGGGEQEKTVVFFDYDGSIVASYTPEEFQALEQAPANPVHAGLVSQGWNWPLADAKAYVQKYGRLCIGQLYITESGETIIKIKITTGNYTLDVGLLIDADAGGIGINWGDGSTQRFTTHGRYSKVNHTYQNAGEYVISLSPNLADGNIYYFSCTYSVVYGVHCGKQVGLYTIALGGGANPKYVTVPQNLALYAGGRFFEVSSMIGFSLNVQDVLPTYLLSGCRALKLLSFNWGNIKAIPDYFANNCHALEHVSLPDGCTDIGQSAFSGCRSLKDLQVPDTLQTIGRSAFSNCTFNMIELPATIQTIGVSAFNSCYSLETVIVKAPTPPALDNTNAFSTVPSYAKFYVPDEAVEDYKAATNWNAFSDRIFPISALTE